MSPEAKVTISVKELLEALRGIEKWVKAVRTVVATLPKDTKFTVADPPKVAPVGISKNCPPPE